MSSLRFEAIQTLRNPDQSACNATAPQKDTHIPHDPHPKRRYRLDCPMRTIGSLSLCRSLLRAGLVDRFRVVIFPVMTGKTGRERIYDGYPDVALDMLASRTFDGKIQLVEYVPLVLEGLPWPQ